MHRFLRNTFFILCAVSFVVLSSSAQSKNSGRGRKFHEPPPTARLEITVIHDTNGKPIENASVIFHELDSRDKGNMELRTNEDGKTIIDVLEIGTTVRFQIVAAGYQTYGQDFKIDKANLNLLVKLSRPVSQYSIYSDHSKDKPQPAPAPVPAENGQQGQPQSQQPK